MPWGMQVMSSGGKRASALLQTPRLCMTRLALMPQGQLKAAACLPACSQQGLWGKDPHRGTENQKTCHATLSTQPCWEHIAYIGQTL